MQIVTIVIFILLCISAPWVSRKWGWRGALAWGIITLAFLITAILLLDWLGYAIRCERTLKLGVFHHLISQAIPRRFFFTRSWPFFEHSCPLFDEQLHTLISKEAYRWVTCYIWDLQSFSSRSPMDSLLSVSGWRRRTNERFICNHRCDYAHFNRLSCSGVA